MPREDVILRFGADVAGLRQDMSKAQRTVDGAVRQMRNVLGTLGVGLSIGGLANAFGRIVAEGDRLQKLAIRLGETTENLSQLQYVAERSAVPFNTMATALQRAQRRISEAAQGAGEARNALAELGLNAERLNLLRPTDQLLAVAEAMEDVRNSGDRTRLLMRLFDSEGVAMGQAMEEGAAGIRALMQEADELGATLDRRTADAMARTQDLMAELNARSTALGRSLAIELLPEVNEFLETLNELANGPAGQGVKAVLSEISAEVQFLASLLAGDWRSAWNNFLPVRMLTDEGEGYRIPPGGKLEIGVDGDALEGVKRDLAASVRAMMAAAAQEGVNLRVNSGQRDPEHNARVGGVPNSKHITGGAVDIGGDQQWVLDNAERFGLSTYVGEGYNHVHVEMARRRAVAVKDTAKAKRAAATATRTLTDEEREHQRIMREGAAIFEATRTAAEAHALQMDRLTELHAAGAISLETFARAARQSAEPLMQIKDVAEESSRAAEDMGLAFESAMGRLITQGGNARDVLQALLQDIAQITYRETLGKTISGAVTDIVASIDFGEIFSFGGGRAGGGSVSAGTAYLVGERGPELFTPSANGSIVPNDALSMRSASSGVEINVIESPGRGGEVTQRDDSSGQRIIDVLVERVRGAMEADIAKGSGLARSLEGQYGLSRAPGGF